MGRKALAIKALDATMAPTPISPLMTSSAATASINDCCVYCTNFTAACRRCVVS